MSEELDSLRKKIKEIDNKLLQFIAERNDVVRLIGELKKKEGLPVRNLKIEKENGERLEQEALKIGADPDEIKPVFKELIKVARRIQGEG